MTNENSNQQWEYLKEIGEAERHFNTIQARYRLLASTWLLASLAGIGFVMTELHEQQEQDLILFLIAAGGSIGIIAIWVLDILGYHRLLGAYFLEGLRIELENQNLPQIRWLMIELGTVGNKAKLFYFLCALAPVSVGLILLLQSLKLKLDDMNLDDMRLVKIVLLVALLAAVFVTRKITKDPEHRAKYSDLEAKKGEALVYDGRPQESIAWIQKAMRLNPHHPDWFYWTLAIAEYANDQYEEAVATMKKMNEIPNRARYIVAAAYVQLGELEEAQVVVKTILENNPEYSLEKLRLFFASKYKDLTIPERYIEDMRKAGLPE